MITKRYFLISQLLMGLFFRNILHTSNRFSVFLYIGKLNLGIFMYKSYITYDSLDEIIKN